MIHQMEYWGFKQPNNINDGDIFIDCQFPQFAPGTDIFAGKEDLTFIGECNLINTVMHDSFEVDVRCNVAQNIYELEEGEEDLLQ